MSVWRTAIIIQQRALLAGMTALEGRQTDVHGNATNSPVDDTTDYDRASGLSDIGRAGMGYLLPRDQFGLDNAIRII